MATIPSMDPLNPQEEEQKAPSYTDLLGLLNKSEQEKNIEQQIETEKSPEAEKRRQETSSLLGIARALGAGVAEYGQAGGGEKFSKATEGVVESAAGSPLKDLQAKLASAKGAREEEFAGKLKAADLFAKLQPKAGDRIKYELRTATDPSTGKRSVLAFNPYNPTEPPRAMAENPAIPGQFTDPTTGEVFLLSKDMSTEGNPIIQQVTGTPQPTEEAKKKDPAEAWKAVPPAVKKRVSPLLKEYRKAKTEAQEARDEVNVVKNAMEEYVKAPPGQRNAQLLNLVRGKIPRLAGEKGPLAVFDVQMYAGNQSLFNRANRFFKSIYNGEATDKDIEDNLDLLRKLSGEMDSRINRRLSTYKEPIDMEVGAYKVDADMLVKGKENEAPTAATSSVEDAVIVNWKGKNKKIPRSRLQEALKAGATEVGGQ